MYRNKRRQTSGHHHQSHQAAAFSAVFACQKFLLGRLGLDVVAILVEMIGAHAQGARRPNLRRILATSALEELTSEETQDQGNQEYHQDDRHHKIELHVRRLIGESIGWGCIVGHTVALLDP